MNATAVRMIAPRCLGAAVGVLLLSYSLVVGQQSGGGGSGPAKPKPAEKPAAKSLEDLLAAALKSNPDVRVAEAKVREAEAELNRTRLQTTQKIVTLYRGLEAQKALVQSAEAEALRFAQLQATGAASTSGVEPSRQKALQAKAKLSEIEAEIDYLTGRQPGGSAAERVAAELERLLAVQSLAQTAATVEVAAKGASKPQSTMSEKLRDALDTPIKVDFQKKTPADILKELQRKLEGVPIRIRTDLPVMGVPLTLQFAEPVPLGAVFQLLEDETQELLFFVREYGIVIGTNQNPRLHPPDAEGLVDFWKSLRRPRFFRGGSSPFPSRQP